MAELATIARPYAEALFQAADGGGVDGFPWKQPLQALAQLASDPQLRQLADNPKVAPGQVFELIAGLVPGGLDAKLGNLLRTVLDNGRLSALPEIVRQVQALVDARSGVSQATIHSAFGLTEAQLADVLPALEKRFGRKLQATVVEEPSLIGGIRVVVGDEVLDTSVQARLQQMQAALVA
jgi:F-type H+-transporting ATPase subunit delta